jgi:hypothetical protein
MQIRRALGVAFVLLGAATPTFGQRNNNDNNQRPQQAQRPVQEQQDIDVLVTAVDTALMTDPLAAGAAAPGVTPAAAPATPAAPAADQSVGDIGVKWESNHFVKGQTDTTYVPYTLAIDRANLPASGVALYVRVVDQQQVGSFVQTMASLKTATEKELASFKRPTFAWDNIHFIDIPQDGKLSRAIQLKPGRYVAFIAIKEKSPAPPAANQRNQRNQNQANAPAAAAAPAPKVGLLRHELIVPDFAVPDLTTSSIILASTVEPVASQLSPAEQEANPYVFGPMRIVPAREGRFSKQQELQVIFWIYGAAEAAGGKPSVVAEYNFHQRLAGGEKYFNKTQPQELNAQTLPPEFSVAAGHQLPGSLVVPLASFPAGDYRLEIKITDKPTGKVVTQNVNFTVLPV